MATSAHVYRVLDRRTLSGAVKDDDSNARPHRLEAELLSHPCGHRGSHQPHVQKSYHRGRHRRRTLVLSRPDRAECEIKLSPCLDGEGRTRGPVSLQGPCPHPTSPSATMRPGSWGSERRRATSVTVPATQGPRAPRSGPPRHTAASRGARPTSSPRAGAWPRRGFGPAPGTRRLARSPGCASGHPAGPGRGRSPAAVGAGCDPKRDAQVRPSVEARLTMVR
jgi:hypothetical protein